MNNGFVDFNKGPIQYYPIHDYAEYVVNSPQNAKKVAKYWAISYVTTFVKSQLNCTTQPSIDFL